MSLLWQRILLGIEIAGKLITLLYNTVIRNSWFAGVAEWFRRRAADLLMWVQFPPPAPRCKNDP